MGKVTAFMTAWGNCLFRFYPVHIAVFAYARCNKTPFHGPVMEKKTASGLWLTDFTANTIHMHQKSAIL